MQDIYDHYTNQFLNILFKEPIYGALLMHVNVFISAALTPRNEKIHFIFFMLDFHFSHKMPSLHTHKIAPFSFT